MKYTYTIKLLLLVSILLILHSCSKRKKAENCSKNLIELLKNEPLRNPPAKLYKWKVDSKTYYYIPPYCCDQFSSLYDINCSLICAPDGGFTGKGDGNCPEFNGKVKSTLLWEDTRK
jgi:hypothetical protein